jgi:hypothetical protein
MLSSKLPWIESTFEWKMSDSDGKRSSSGDKTLVSLSYPDPHSTSLSKNVTVTCPMNRFHFYQYNTNCHQHTLLSSLCPRVIPGLCPTSMNFSRVCNHLHRIHPSPRAHSNLSPQPPPHIIIPLSLLQYTLLRRLAHNLIISLLFWYMPSPFPQSRLNSTRAQSLTSL